MPDRSLDDVSVRHLLDLGYTDPVESAAREAERRKQREAVLRDAAEAHRAGDNSHAIALLSALIAEDPGWTLPRKQLAAIYFNTDDFDKAQSELDWLTHHGVEHPRLAFMSGAIALRQRRMSDAIEYLEYAEYIEPELTGAARLLGSAYLRLNRLDEATNVFERALKVDASDAVALDGLAAVCLRKGDFEQAAEYALTALDHDIRMFSAHYHLGIALAKIGRANEAIQAFETAARLDRKRSTPFRWLQRVAQLQLADADRAALYRERGKQVIRERRNLA